MKSYRHHRLQKYFYIGVTDNVIINNEVFGTCMPHSYPAHPPLIPEPITIASKTFIFIYWDYIRYLFND
ncbi:MAG: hypothetical protein KTR26_04020 [Flammeovirgaceae bacterium]|nr:hypothetical protein [Flammeovirgaceae bacterium]